MQSKYSSQSLAQLKPTVWGSGASKKVMVLYPSGAGQQMHFTLGCLLAAAALAVPSTSSIYRLPVVELSEFGTSSTAASVLRDEVEELSIPSILQKIRKRTALTWEQLGLIFGVSRRAVHHWANGNPVTAYNQMKVRSLLEETEAYENLEPFVARTRLLDRYGIEIIKDDFAQYQPILSADHTPLAVEGEVRKTPVTRIRRG